MIKDKIKTLIIGGVTALLTSCGFKQKDAKITERAPTAHAYHIDVVLSESALKEFEQERLAKQQQQYSDEQLDSLAELKYKKDKPIFASQEEIVGSLNEAGNLKITENSDDLKRVQRKINKALNTIGNAVKENVASQTPAEIKKMGRTRPSNGRE